jgi:hypothetical protein
MSVVLLGHFEQMSLSFTVPRFKVIFCASLLAPLLNIRGTVWK